MKQLLLILFIYFSFGVTRFDELDFVGSSIVMTMPNIKEMDREVKKINKVLVKTAVLNSGLESKINYLDSINNALDSKKSIREFKNESRKKNN
jgi:hypothetical protein